MTESEKNPIRILIIEDSEDDALLILRELKKGGFDVHWRIVETPTAMHAALDKEPWDIILSDFQMPTFDGGEALRIVHEKGLDIPFIVISGVLIEEKAVEILKAGASDYVKKGNWARLIPAVGRELREAKSRRERRQARKDKTEAQERYRHLFDSAVEGVFQSTPSGRFITVNPAMAQLLGYNTPSELMEMVTDIPMQLYVHSSDRDLFIAMIRNSGTVTDFETEMYRRDGSRTWISISSRGIFDDNGELELIEGFAVDITERKRAQAELAEMNRELEHLVTERTIDLKRKALELEQANMRLKELDQLKTTFLSSVSHELRTPLTSVLGFAKLIRKDFCKTFLPDATFNKSMGKMGERICSNLDIIVHEGERLTRLVNDFLDLTRIEAGRMRWDDQQVQPAEVLKRSALAVTGLYEQRPEIKLVVDIPETLPELVWDPDRLTQVVINLLNNAAKFTQAGNVVLHAETDKKCQAVIVSVSDTGMGIPAADLENIFTKFHQVKGQLPQDPGARGSGLGLAISRQIVRRYGGDIDVESKVGKGSVFSVTLPLDPGLICKDDQPI